MSRPALTICQPFAEWIAAGQKWVENRAWRTTWRGWLAIHAGRSRAWFPPPGVHGPDWRRFEFGAVVAVARLAAVVHLDKIRREARGPQSGVVIAGTGRTWREVAEHEHTFGPWCWVLADVRRVSPAVACSGRQGIWPLDDDTLAAIRRTLGKGKE